MVMGLPYFGKDVQISILESLGVKTPRTFFVPDTHDYEFHLPKMLSDFKNDDVVIVKSLYGARGIGQVKLPLLKLYEFLCDSHGSYEDLYEKWKDYLGSSGFDEDEKYYLRKSLKNCEYIIQEFLEVRNEYRAFLFYDDESRIFKKERTKNSWQVNGQGKQIWDTCSLQNHEQLSPPIQAINSWMYKQRVPWLMVDLYDTQNSVGVFEFCMDFGMSRIDHESLTELADLMTKSVTRLYEQGR